MAGTISDGTTVVRDPITGRMTLTRGGGGLYRTDPSNLDPLDPRARKFGVDGGTDTYGTPGGAILNEDPSALNDERTTVRQILGDQLMAQRDDKGLAALEPSLARLGQIDSNQYRTLADRASGIGVGGPDAAGLAANRDALGMLRGYATGNQSVARAQGEIAAARQAQAIGQQLSANRGRMSGAQLRGAQMALSRGLADIDATTAAQAIAERQGAVGALSSAGLAAQQVAAQQAAQRAGIDLMAAQTSGQLRGVGDATDAQMASRYLAQLQANRGNVQQAYGTVLGVPSAPAGPGTWETIASVLGGLGGIGIGAAALSDETAKTEKKPADKLVQDLLDALEARSWRYKPGHEDGGSERHTGVMAQALQQSELGSRLVDEGPDGLLRVDYSPQKAGPLMMAALANLNKRIEALGA